MADSYPELPYEEKQVLRLIAKSAQGISINNIKKSLDISDYKVRKCVESLDGRNLVRKEGNGPSSKYFVGFESIEFLTQLQIMMDSLKKADGIKIPHLLNIFWVSFEKQGNKGKFNVQDKNYKRKCPKISFDYLLNALFSVLSVLKWKRVISRK